MNVAQDGAGFWWRGSGAVDRTVGKKVFSGCIESDFVVAVVNANSLATAGDKFENSLVRPLSGLLNVARFRYAVPKSLPNPSASS